MAAKFAMCRNNKLELIFRGSSFYQSKMIDIELMFEKLANPTFFFSDLESDWVTWRPCNLGPNGVKYL